MKQNAIEVIKALEVSNFEKNQIIAGVLGIDNKELNTLMVKFAYEELDKEEMAHAMAFEIVYHGYIEIDAFRNGYIVMDHADFGDYLIEENL